VTAGGADAVAFRHAVHALLCDRAQPWAHGTVVAARDLPTYYTYNSVRVEDGARGLTVPELIATADRLQSGLGHRQVEVEDERAGTRLRPGFEAAGWICERLVWMALDGPARAGAGAATAEIGEVPFPRTRALREAWFGTSPFAGDAQTQERFLRMEEMVAARRGTRALAAFAPAGEPAGFAAFSVVGGEAEVEQVYVDPARRGAGMGGALVAAAVAAARTPRSWIIADDEGAPKRLYGRLGFRPVWIQHVFTRTPA
jgi:GNAT superfamily N-acetyltransferase